LFTHYSQHLAYIYSDRVATQLRIEARELLYEQFNQAINQLKESIKKGDYEGEIAHRMTAEWLNNELKKRGY
jgi:hypothetical protein